MLTASEAKKRLEELKAKGANLLIPDICLEGLSDWHRVVIEELNFDPTPAPNGQDCYPAKGKANHFRLSGKALEKIGVSGGIKWNIPECKTIERSEFYYAHRSVGGIQKPDGAIVWWSGEYDQDAHIERSKIEAQAKQYNKSEAWILDQYNQKITYRRQLCASGSRNVVIRKLFNVKDAYSAPEMKNSFVTVRVIFQPNLNDEKVKMRMLERALDAQFGVYGGQAALPAPQSYDNGQAIDLGRESDIPDNIDPDMPTYPEPTQPPPPDDREVMPPDQGGGGPPMDDDPPPFPELDKDAQVEVLSKLAQKKGFQTTPLITPQEAKAGKKGLTKPFALMNDKSRMDWFAYLSSQPDDDVPY